MDPYDRLAGLSLMLPPEWLSLLSDFGDELLDAYIAEELARSARAQQA